MSANEAAEVHLQCVMFCEFDPIAGPKIYYQTPEDVISKDHFDSIAPYIITKPQLQNRLITLKAFGYKFIGSPVGITNAKYSRNALLFNACFVFNEEDPTCAYESVVKKIASYLTTLELESGYLSQETTKKNLCVVLDKIWHDLSNGDECKVPIDGTNTLYLKVVQDFGDPPSVHDHDVPVFLWNRKAIVPLHWDLIAQQIFPHINGFNHVQKISTIADVDLGLARIAFQTLVYYGVVKMIPIFQYTNMYSLTQKINELFKDKDMQEECVHWVAKGGASRLPHFRDVFVLYCSLGPGVSVKDLCIRHNPGKLLVDERLLIQYGLIKGLVCKLNKYPVLLTSEHTSSKLKSVAKWLNGYYSYDEICCKSSATGDGIKFKELDDKTENDPYVVHIWK